MWMSVDNNCCGHAVFYSHSSYSFFFLFITSGCFCISVSCLFLGRFLLSGSLTFGTSLYLAFFAFSTAALTHWWAFFVADPEPGINLEKTFLCDRCIDLFFSSVQHNQLLPRPQPVFSFPQVLTFEVKWEFIIIPLLLLKVRFKRDKSEF